MNYDETKNGSPVITVAEAHITTVTVSIQVMRIGPKQMTLTVFRQLQVTDVFDEKGNGSHGQQQPANCR